MTDPSSGITLITTIGILPNKKLNTGLIFIVKNKKIMVVKPLLEGKKVRFSDYSFKIKGLKYSIEGTDWRLEYRSKKYRFDILFRPINKIYPYITERSDTIFSSIGSQHYEQFGLFEGELSINGERHTIGPCFGHRDHSWGIRDWSPIDWYRLFCCAFSENFAFNLWEGSIYGQEFLKGYVFDGRKNTRIVESRIVNDYDKNGKKPKSAAIVIKDEKGRKFDIKCSTVFSILIPPRKSIMYESLGEMHIDGKVGYGVQEYLYHEPGRLYRTAVFLKLLKYL